MANLSDIDQSGTPIAYEVSDNHAPIDERALSKLRWRCRRGLLENDLFIDRFFKEHGDRITLGEAQGLSELMALSDNDLLDILLSRKSIAAIEPALDTEYVNQVIQLLKGKR